MASVRLALLALAAIVATGAAGAGAAPAVRDAALGVYVHGMTQQIADAEVGPSGVPELLDLLRDPVFPRPDNVVAFLAYLGGPETTPELLRFAAEPRPSPISADEDRARLLVPEALGRIGARGDGAALAALRAWAGSRLVPPEIARLSASALAGLGRPRAGTGFAAPPSPPATGPLSIDPSADVDDSRLDYANHPDVTSPMTDDRLDGVLHQAGLVAGRADYLGDLACCATFSRLGTEKTFGAHGDGHDVIDTEAEEGVVISDPTARVKIVRLIQSCGGPGTNIIGCSFLGGKGMAVVRLTSLPLESILWLHEYGHNVGLGHAQGDPRLVMSPAINTGSVGLRSSDCAAYHAPPPGAQAIVTSTGTCADEDADEVQDGIDNCPGIPNGDQSDADGDGIGDVCQPCSDPQAPDFDHDGIPDACETNAVLADADLSGRVDGFDLGRLARAFGARAGDPRYDVSVDLSRDGIVDGDDLALLAPWFGQTT